MITKMIKEKHELEDLEEEKTMNEWMKQADVKNIRKQEKARKKIEL